MPISSPIIILGVPRSGTTILRVLIGSHSKIQASSETPWITGGYGGPVSIRALIEQLITSRTGPVNSLQGVDEQTIFRAGLRFFEEIMSAYMEGKNKSRLLLKTPDDANAIEFLVRMFPDSQYIHISRDGRDVACSTLSKRGKLLGSNLKGYGELTLESALQRWCDWEERIRSYIESGKIPSSISITYDELVIEPSATLQRICAYLGIEFEPEMLMYSGKTHDLPEWEAGSMDVKSRKSIDTTRLGRWKTEIEVADMLWIDEAFGQQFIKLGYRLCAEEVDLSGRFPRYISPTLYRKLRHSPRIAFNILKLLARVPRRLARCFKNNSIKAWQQIGK